MQPIRLQQALRLRAGSLLSSTGLPISLRTKQTLLTNAKLTRVNQRSYTSQTEEIWDSTEASPPRVLKDRVQAIDRAFPDAYPRLVSNENSVSPAEFHERYSHLQDGETVEEDTVVVNGKIRTYRLVGSGLIFFDLVQNGHQVQVMCNRRQLNDVGITIFKHHYRLLRRGDAFSVTGHPHRTGRGGLTVMATELPRLLSPCLHDIPLDARKHETSPYARHVQFLADRTAVNVIKARSSITQYLRQFFVDQSFLEVNTPILEAVAGGAIARPFYTSATEFRDRQLSLRIAPELWLKRLVVGGFDRVFEIGPSFRNEGIDKTHNPEFTTCEFYHAYANLDDLMSTTEKLLSGLAEHIRTSYYDNYRLKKPTEVDFSAPFRRIDFIPAIEEKIGRKLPLLTAPGALEEVTEIFEELSLKLPDNPNLPRLLDELCSIYIEPECINPTFIINPPECLSPLSKSFIHPTTTQRVAARGELFIEGREMVNTYEEENSPVEQRRKFQDQVRYSKDANESGEIDESYLRALEWGLPPTGGWGCGIDRLCMLFTGMQRIGDVLPFGTLRKVSLRPTVAAPSTSSEDSASSEDKDAVKIDVE
ncbi:putative lysyl-tRNA synthetase [Aspergillus ellipticus CBS 707.79]|uniref:lysine--tRNA ligase n=1 Tax=Aspergillus ellipticus CBS 707.79 TaxID=1448320 RepID=A0A319DFX0_9EURO|nr:putative lysyl-tRNA synthetase [Aspergillus ellipticus CBS 707.79]